RHPQIAAELAECLDGLEMLRAAAPRLLPPVAIAEPAALGGPAGTLGDFRILGEAGRGGMGVVYEAEQISLARRVGLHELSFVATLDSRQRPRLDHEVRAAPRLHD